MSSAIQSVLGFVQTNSLPNGQLSNERIETIAHTGLSHQRQVLVIGSPISSFTTSDYSYSDSQSQVNSLEQTRDFLGDCDDVICPLSEISEELNMNIHSTVCCMLYLSATDTVSVVSDITVSEYKTLY